MSHTLADTLRKYIDEMEVTVKPKNLPVNAWGEGAEFHLHPQLFSDYKCRIGKHHDSMG